jgi:hypothetical protein
MSEEIIQLKNQIKELEKQLELKNKLVFVLEESIPKKQEDRKKYMADIAFFYASIFKEKLQHFIGEQLNELAQIGRTETLNNIIRSNINAFRLIQEWMEEKTNEHIGNIEEIRNGLDDDKEFISKIKKDYGEN